MRKTSEYGRQPRAFTLIEMLISIVILSIMMLFLYKSHASLNRSNSVYKKELNAIEYEYRKKKMIFLDFTLALNKKVDIKNQDIKEDVVFFQSTNSIHNRINPYVAYVVKETKLYRLESVKEFKVYPLRHDHEFVAEYLGEVNSFRVYKSTDSKASYLVHIDFKTDEDILMKLNVLENHA